jgi:hypothetical protein
VLLLLLVVVVVLLLLLVVVVVVVVVVTEPASSRQIPQPYAVGWQCNLRENKPHPQIFYSVWYSVNLPL